MKNELLDQVLEILPDMADRTEELLKVISLCYDQGVKDCSDPEVIFAIIQPRMAKEIANSFDRGMEATLAMFEMGHAIFPEQTFEECIAAMKEVLEESK